MYDIGFNNNGFSDEIPYMMENTVEEFDRVLSLTWADDFEPVAEYDCD